MSAFLSILKNDFRIIIRDVKALALLLVMPVLVIAIFAGALGPMLEKTSFVEPFSIAVVDKENSVWTGILTAQLRNLDILKEIHRTDEDNAREMLKNSEIAAAIVIPPNMSSSVDRWEPAQGKVIGNSMLYLQSQLIRNVAVVGSTSVSAGLAALNAINDYEYEAGFDSGQVYQDIVLANEKFINGVLARKDIFVETRQEKSKLSPVAYYAASLLAVFIMFSSIPCIKLLNEERKLGISNRIHAAPVKGWQSITSKLILSVLISAAQFLLIGIFLRATTRNFFGIPVGSMVLVFLCTTIAGAALSLLVASFATSVASTDLIANLSILLMAIVGGSVYPLASLPDPCRALSVFTINRWSQQGFLAVFEGGNAVDISQSCLALIILALSYLIVALVIYRIRRGRLN